MAHVLVDVHGAPGRQQMQLREALLHPGLHPLDGLVAGQDRVIALHHQRCFGAEGPDELGFEPRPVVVPARREQAVLALVFRQLSR